MKKLALILCAVLAGCATPKPEGEQITVSTSRAQQCKAAGGCGLMTAAEVASLQMRAYKQGLADAAEALAAELDTHGCKRGNT